MDIRKAYLRRSKRQARLQKRLAVAAVLVASAWALVQLLAEQEAPGQDALVAALAAPAPAGVVRAADQPAPAEARRVYPYSIVPGGLKNQAELGHAVMADRVVAAHYAGFAVHQASLRTVGKARAVYVSYRKGEQVYWTAKKVMLAQGETLLSDGQNEIRTRCGNRISDTPQLPVEARGPSEQELDTPLEQADDAELRQVANDAEPAAGEGAPFALQSFPNGAGLLVAAQTGSSADRGASGNLDGNRFTALPASPVSSLPVQGRRTLGAVTASGKTAVASGEASRTDSGELVFGSDSGGSGNGGDPAHGIWDGNASLPGSPGSDAAGGDAGGATSGTATPGASNGSQAPASSLRPDGLPNTTLPAREHAVPEPGSLWLTGLAAAILVLQRRRTGALRRSR